MHKTKENPGVVGLIFANDMFLLCNGSYIYKSQLHLSVAVTMLACSKVIIVECELLFTGLDLQSALGYSLDNIMDSLVFTVLFSAVHFVK